eukprot:TRINITY_DN29547_c0_g1_i2.p1 TRINITY_DN29547_c0_g1~~TRINITY_DN29547_c0_g1_i2.p1  ORF type:complete len:308 (-),score=48.87 TRINITY_DN29547_c0_g1_i2:156-1079(-)
MSADDKINFILKDVGEDLPTFILAQQDGYHMIEDGDSEILLKWFCGVVQNNNPDAQLIFSDSLNRTHRAYFHNIVQRRFKKCLVGASQGVGQNRKLHIVKLGKFVKFYDQLNEEQKQKVGQLFRWVKNTTLQYSRDEIAECVLCENIPDDLQSVWDTQQQQQRQIQDLIRAAQNGNLSQIQKITAENPEILTKEQTDLISGQTALHVAAQNGQLQIIQHLVNNGCDVDIMNDKNESPLDVARFYEQCEAEGLLIQLGAFDPTGHRFPIQSIQQVQNLGENYQNQIQKCGNGNQNIGQGDGLWGTDLS